MSVFPGGLEDDSVESLVNKAVAAERERCAKLVDDFWAATDEPSAMVIWRIAAAIRKTPS